MIDVRIHNSYISKDINMLDQIIHVYKSRDFAKSDDYFGFLGKISHDYTRASNGFGRRVSYFDWKIVVSNDKNDKADSFIRSYLFNLNSKTRELLPAWMAAKGSDISSLLMFHPEILDGKFYGQDKQSNKL